jgi:spoIIIJ-associated protein
LSESPKTNANITEKRAKSVEEAISEALSELGISKENADIQIVQEPSKGFLGLGAKEAVVRVSKKSSASAKTQAEPIEVKSEQETAPEQINAEPAAEKPENTNNSSKSPVEEAKTFISSILNAMGLDVKVDAVLEDGVVNVNLEGENMGIVIGKRGDTLDSLQYLTSLVINRNSDDYVKVSIDTENYRAKRAETLIALSNKLAARVIKTGKKFPLEEMNPYERRIIHANLQDNDAVTTYSVGQEPHRRVVIAPKNPKPYNKRGGYNKNRGGKRSNSSRGGYSRPNYDKQVKKPAQAADSSEKSSATYKADFKPTPHKPEYKDFAEYLAAQSNK